MSLAVDIYRSLIVDIDWFFPLFGEWMRVLYSIPSFNLWSIYSLVNNNYFYFITTINYTSPFALITHWNWAKVKWIEEKKEKFVRNRIFTYSKILFYFLPEQLFWSRTCLLGINPTINLNAQRSKKKNQIFFSLYA